MDFDWGSGIGNDWASDTPDWSSWDGGGFAAPASQGPVMPEMSWDWGGGQSQAPAAPASASPGWGDYRQGEYNAPEQASPQAWLSAAAAARPSSTQDAAQWLYNMRNNEPGMGEIPNLRNAEHAAYAQGSIDSSPYGPLPAALAPHYSAAKYLMQNILPRQAAEILNPIPKYLGMDMLKATQPSWSEMWWGMKPLFSRVLPDVKNMPGGNPPPMSPPSGGKSGYYY